MIVYVGKKLDKVPLVAVSNEQEAIKAMYQYCKQIGHKIYYTIRAEDEQYIRYDVGSWTWFFWILRSDFDEQ